MSGVILLYHRVVELANDPQLLAVSPANFSDHLEVLQRVATPCSIGQMLVTANDPRDTSRKVAITFDDGYWDNHAHALPILEHGEIPATVFATTAHTDTTKEFFWDELDRILLQPGNLPRTLEMSSIGYRIGLDGAAKYSTADFDRDRAWNVISEKFPTPRHQAYAELCAKLHASPWRVRNTALAELQAWSGMGSDGRLSHRMMSAEELRELDASGLVEVGAHTRNHPRLSAETVAEAAFELATDLTDLLGHPVWGFSYPFGTRKDYTPATIDAVRDSGYAFACSNFNGLVDSGADRLQLPRFIVRDWSADEFEHRLRTFLSWKPPTRAVA